MPCIKQISTQQAPDSPLRTVSAVEGSSFSFRARVTQYVEYMLALIVYTILLPGTRSFRTLSINPNYKKYISYRQKTKGKADLGDSSFLGEDSNRFEGTEKKDSEIGILNPS